MNEMSFDDVVSEANKLVKELNGDVDGTPVDTGKDRSYLIPIRRRLKRTISQSVNATSFQSVLDHMGIDTSNLPEGFKLIHRRQGEEVVLIFGWLECMNAMRHLQVV